MELELGLKLTKVAEEFASTDLLIAKDRSGPLFLTQQTDSMFILTAHLKGYRRKNIKIDINEDGSRITISGEKQVQETLMVGWKVVKKDIEIRGFRKAFKIPEGVVLDKIKARFNEDESKLVIRMPKSVKGVGGVGIEELEEEEVSRGPTESLGVLGNGETSEQEDGRDHEAREVQEIDESMGEGLEEAAQKESQENQEIQEMASPCDKQEENDQDSLENVQKGGPEEHRAPDTKSELEDGSQSKGSENEEVRQEIEGEKKPELDQDLPNQTVGKGNDIQEAKSPRSTSRICTPIIAGSALVVSLIVLVFHLIRSKNQSNKKRD